MLPQGKFVVIFKLKARGDEFDNKQAHFHEEKQDYGEEAAEETKEMLQGNDDFDRGDE